MIEIKQSCAPVILISEVLPVPVTQQEYGCARYAITSGARAHQFYNCLLFSREIRVQRRDTAILFRLAESF